MRKGILGLLAYCLTGLEMAHGQTGYQEPMPIQSPGMRYGGMPYAAPAPGRFPNYPPPPSPYFVPMQPMPQQVQGNWAPPGYPVPMGWAPNAGYDPRRYNPAGAQQPLPPFNAPQGDGQLPATQVKNEQLAGPEKIAGPRKKSEAAPQENLPSLEEILEEVGHVGDGPPPEPAEPYMIGRESSWKPRKGYSMYGSADYLFWWLKSQQLPANLTLSISDPNNVPELSNPAHSGGRVFLGSWVNDRQNLALEGGYFFLGARSVTTTQNFPGSAIDASPVFNGIVSESSLLTSSTSFWGAEANLRYQACQYKCGQVGAYLDLLGGFRFVDLSESMSINGSTSFATNPVLLSDALIATSDAFGTHNHFFAGQIGVDAGFNLSHFNFNVFSKFALGGNRQTVVIDGSGLVTGPPVLGTFEVPGGFYAQPSNIGRFTHNELSFLPEAGFNMNYKLGDHWRFGVGYTFVYFYNVVRPADQIDVTAGGGTRPPLFFLGGSRPQPTFTNFNETAFWAQGINLTVEVSY